MDRDQADRGSPLREVPASSTVEQWRWPALTNRQVFSGRPPESYGTALARRMEDVACTNQCTKVDADPGRVEGSDRRGQLRPRGAGPVSSRGGRQRRENAPSRSLARDVERHRGVHSETHQGVHERRSIVSAWVRPRLNPAPKRPAGRGSRSKARVDRESRSGPRRKAAGSGPLWRRLSQ